MTIAEIIQPGDKVDISFVQNVERAKKDQSMPKIYKSQVLDLKENGNLEISMPVERGKLVLLPLGLFMFLAQAIPLSPLQSLLLLVPVIAFEVWLVIRHLLPVMGELVTKTLYSSNITTDEEVLVEASRRMLNSGDPQGALELLERYRKENPGLVRSWLMESSLLNDMRRYADSVNVLQKGLEYGGWRKEDRALFLYKIGAIYESQLNNPDRARKYWEEAADKYPDTAYGRSALDKL